MKNDRVIQFSNFCESLNGSHSLNKTFDYGRLGKKNFEMNPDLEHFYNIEELQASLRQLSNNLYQISSLIVIKIFFIF